MVPLSTAPPARPEKAGSLRARALPAEKRQVLKDFALGSGIAALLGAVENFGTTAKLAPEARLPFSEYAPNALWDRHVTEPLGRAIEKHPGLKKIPFLASYPYWAFLVVAPALVPTLLSAYRAHRRGESVKPYLADAAVTAFASLAVQDAGYWLANPAFGGARALLGRPYYSAVPQDGWLGALPVVGEILGRNVPLLNVPVAYLLAGTVAGAWLAWRLGRRT
jgi:hypothetical protein